MRRTLLSVSLVAGLAAPIALAVPAQAVGPFPRKAVEQAIENQIPKVLGHKATVKCPARNKWVKGAKFYCTAKPANGASYRVRVTLGKAKTHSFKWLTVG
ncbi:MAG TPA: DUF4333 domain-containing protein [Actinomycetota bacterium]|nr:DUF4333 domain-containing protein [Actinomycetota bacterium]